jgi:hypothetical protein
MLLASRDRPTESLPSGCIAHQAMIPLKVEIGLQAQHDVRLDTRSVQSRGICTTGVMLGHLLDELQFLSVRIPAHCKRIWDTPAKRSLSHLVSGTYSQ